MKVKLTATGRTELKTILGSFLANFTNEIPWPWVEVLTDSIGIFLRTPGVLVEDPFAFVAGVDEPE